MILSMTGFGYGTSVGDDTTFAAEVRSVNNRHLKLNYRAPEPYPVLESEVEKLVRQSIRRGSVSVHLTCARPPRPGDQRLNVELLRNTIGQIRAVAREADIDPAPLLSGVLALPDMTTDALRREDVEADWPAIRDAVSAALAAHRSMRSSEGTAMARELIAYHDEIAGHLRAVRELAPRAVGSYAGRLRERVQALVAEFGVTVQPEDLIREVAIFAERADVAEEIVRLESHLAQFAELVRAGGDSAGRKLEFITQEMGRETNTIGSKAGDVAIGRRVVEIKAALEKIRELIQNIE